MERQSSSSSTELIILQQVEFLGLDDNPIFHSELLRILDMYEHSNSDPSNNNAEHHDDDDQDQDANRDPHFANHDDDDDVNYVPQLEDDDDKDELVPWEVRNKFGGQRMRKLEERVINNSKKKAASKTLSLRRKQGHRLKHSYRRSFIPGPF